MLAVRSYTQQDVREAPTVVKLDNRATIAAEFENIREIDVCVVGSFGLRVHRGYLAICHVS